jgi:hypothetical protein
MPPRATPLLSLPLVGLVAACASTPSASPRTDVTPTTTTTRVVGSGGDLALTTAASPTGRTDALAVPLDAAWRSLPAVYTALGIDFTTLDESRHVIGNDALKLRRKLGEVPVTRYLSCGSMNGSDTYEMTMNVQTVLTPAPDGGTTVSSVVLGTARSLLFSSADVTCGTTQQLEQKIVALLLEKARGQ